MVDSTEQQQQDPNDIVAEEYRGANPRLAALGGGVVKHFVWAGWGLLIGGVAAYVMPKFFGGIVESSRGFAKEMTGKAGNGKFFSNVWASIQKGFGEFIYFGFGEGAHVRDIKIDPVDLRHKEWAHHMLRDKQHGFGHWFIGHVVGLLPVVGKWANKGLKLADESKDQRAINALTFGGATAATGYISGWAWGLFNAAHVKNNGKSQFERAQEEIRGLRAYQSQNAQVGSEDYSNQVQANTAEPNTTAVMGQVASGHVAEKSHHAQGAEHGAHHDQAHPHAHGETSQHHEKSAEHHTAPSHEHAPQTSIQAATAHYAGMQQTAASQTVGVPA